MLSRFAQNNPKTALAVLGGVGLLLIWMASGDSSPQRHGAYMQNGQHAYTTRFGSGERNRNGSWSHYNRTSRYGVGGDGKGCYYTPNWSNC